MKGMKAPDVAVVGAGLVGSLLAIYLVRRGIDVHVYECRPDPRCARGDSGRSINLVVTSRGIVAADRVELKETILGMTVPVTGRMIHALDGPEAFQPYGRDASECNYSISRAGLNRTLISEAERRGVRFHFESKLRGADLERGRMELENGSIVEAGIVFGADGAGSAVRAAMAGINGFDESVEPLGHGYKELMIPAGEGGAFRIEKNALHIWPRGDRMLMALPNLDGSFTVTLYMPERGASGLEALRDGECLRVLFEEQFPDSIPLISDLAQDFTANPAGLLATVRCAPWHVGGRALLIGDAAHAIVPFFGQGMNCGFEDCTVLDELLDRYGSNDWARVFEEFSRRRKPDTDAIAEMALDNFVEMRDRVGDPAFLLRKQVEHVLESEMPQRYRSRYSMVMYSSIPYSLARATGVIQQSILDELCEGLDDASRLDRDEAVRLIDERLTPHLERYAVRLDY